MNWKHFGAGVGVTVLVGGAITAGVLLATSPNDTPSGVTTDKPTISSVTQPPKHKPPVTVTETVTKPNWPTETAKTMTPQPTVPVETTSPPVETCAEGNVDPSTWNTADDVYRFDSSGAQIFDIRSGRHECFDQVTFDVEAAGDVGFSVGYADGAVQGQGSGLDQPVAGGAALNVIIDADVPVPDLFVGYDFAADWPALKEVKYLSSFEGKTQFAVGTASKTPFAVELVPNGDTNRVVLYIAHE